MTTTMTTTEGTPTVPVSASEYAEAALERLSRDYRACVRYDRRDGTQTARAVQRAIEDCLEIIDREDGAS